MGFEIRRDQDCKEKGMVMEGEKKRYLSEVQLQRIPLVPVGRYLDVPLKEWKVPKKFLVHNEKERRSRIFGGFDSRFSKTARTLDLGMFSEVGYNYSQVHYYGGPYSELIVRSVSTHTLSQSC